MATANLGRVGFVNKGTYSGATAYKVNDVVVYNSGTYACIQANTGQAPTNTSYWQNWVANDKALDSAVVHKTGDETIAGVKTLTDGLKLQNQNVSPFSGFKNYIINGNFDIWQRGTSQTTIGYGSDDRWFNGNNFSTKTHSRVACTDTEIALFNASYFSRTVVNSVSNADGYVTKRQSIEDVTRLADKTITVSFWAKANGNKKLWIEHKQMYGTGGTPSTTLTGNNVQEFNLTNTWTKYQYTITLPSTIGKTLGTDGVNTSATELQFWFDVGSNSNPRIPTGFQQSGTFDIAQVQLEEGSVATPFEQRPYGLELSLCQRYYYANKGALTANDLTPTMVYYPVYMRVIPSVVGTALGGVGVLSFDYGSNQSHRASATTGAVDFNFTASAEL